LRNGFDLNPEPPALWRGDSDAPKYAPLCNDVLKIGNLQEFFYNSNKLMPLATSAEQAFCAPWLEAELALIAPRVLILIGGLAIGKFLGNDTTMTELIGEQFERDGRIIVPLPHPSGTSQWFHTPENKARLERALEILAELRADLLSK